MKNRDIAYNYLCKLYDRATMRQKVAIITIKDMIIGEKNEKQEEKSDGKK